MNILDKLFKMSNPAPKICKMSNPAPKICKMLKQAIIPYRTTDGAAGYDMSLCMEADEEVEIIDELIASYNVTNRSIIRNVIDIMNESGYYKEPDGVYLMPQSKVHLHTGIRMEIPKGYCGLLMNRSSLSNEEDLTICDNVGLIDSDYRGEVTLWMYNNSDEIKFIPNHSRICQIVLVRHLTSPMEEVDALSYTVRGSGGYGSTGNMTIPDELE